MMQEASLTGLFKTIIYMIGFYYFIKIIARIFMPIVVRKVVTKAQENFQKYQEQGNYYSNYENQNPPQPKSTRDFTKPTKQVGEYVDYEEIKE